jgi:hypothetical protein
METEDYYFEKTESECKVVPVCYRKVQGGARNVT